MKEENNKAKKKVAAIEVRDLVIDFGETLAVDNISFKVYPGELVTLLGPSGCGKTTTLNALAGLLTPTSGQILFKSKDVTKYSPQDRKLGLVFQNYALYPHMSVYKNIAFPLSNDQEWKNKVIRKNELAKLEILSIILKKNGASKEELDKLVKYFDDINITRKQLNNLLQQKISEYNQEFFEAKTEYQLVDIHRNSELVNEAKKVFELLKKHRENVGDITTRIKVTIKKKKILQAKKDKNPEILKRIENYQLDLKALGKKKQRLIKNNKNELKEAKKGYEKNTKAIKRRYKDLKVIAKWKLNITGKMKEITTASDLKRILVQEIIKSLKKENSILAKEKLQWINDFEYPKTNLSEETVEKIDQYINTSKEIYDFLMIKAKEKNAIIEKIKLARVDKKRSETKEYTKKLNNFLEKTNIEKAKKLKTILQAKDNEEKIAKEKVNVLKNKIQEEEGKKTKSSELKELYHQIKVIAGNEKIDNPKNQIQKVKKEIEIANKERLKTFKDYKEKIIKKYSLDKTKLSDKENEQIYQIEKRIISISTAIRNAVMEVSERVDIVKNLAKKPTALSGGQQQRVAIARAIVKNPDVLLMDEPLSNLDAKLRISTREWIRRIQKELGMTTIFVTHDQEEAMSISDRIINMSTGVIQQVGSPMELYLKPRNKFVATFLGMPEMMIYRAKATNGKVTLNSKEIGEIKDKTLKSVDVGIRAEHLKECSAKDAIISGKIEHLEYLGKEILAQIKLTGSKLEGKIFLKNKDQYDIGEMVYATANKKRFHFFSPDTEERIE